MGKSSDLSKSQDPSNLHEFSKTSRSMKIHFKIPTPWGGCNCNGEAKEDKNHEKIKEVLNKSLANLIKPNLSKIVTDTTIDSDEETQIEVVQVYGVQVKEPIPQDITEEMHSKRTPNEELMQNDIEFLQGIISERDIDILALKTALQNQTSLIRQIKKLGAEKEYLLLLSAQQNEALAQMIEIAAVSPRIAEYNIYTLNSKYQDLIAHFPDSPATQKMHVSVAGESAISGE